MIVRPHQRSTTINVTHRRAPTGTEFDWRKSKQLLGTPSHANVLGSTTNLKMSVNSNSKFMWMFTTVFTQDRKSSGWVGVYPCHS